MICVSSLVIVSPRPVPGTARTFGALPALEGLEHALEIFRRNADAGVGDLELRHLAAIAHA